MSQRHQLLVVGSSGKWTMASVAMTATCSSGSGPSSEGVELVVAIANELKLQQQHAVVAIMV